MMKIEKLDCGVRFAEDSLPHLGSASLGIWVGAGSVRENRDIYGISHLIEHMMFKGTKKRSAAKIAEDMDRLGVSVNAFTGKEATCYYLRSLSSNLEKAVEILLDMLRNSVFDPSELAKEKKVIFEEMKMYEDSPDDVVMRTLHQKVFAGTDLESEVLGTRGALKKINPEDIRSYIKDYYTADNTVVAVCGNYDGDALKAMLEKAFKGIKKKSPDRSAADVEFKKKYASKAQDIAQTHLAFGIPAAKLDSEGYYPTALASEIIGGSMSSRLFQSVREEKGLAYSVFSEFYAYVNGGIFSIYAGVGRDKAAEATEAIASEMRKAASEGISAQELASAKERLKSRYIFSLESTSSRMMRMGKSELLINKHYSQEEVVRMIDEVSMEQIMDTVSSFSDLGRYSGSAVSREKIDVGKLVRSTI